MGDRPTRYGSGYWYAEREYHRGHEHTVEQQKDFANRYADDNALQGMDPAEAWKVYTAAFRQVIWPQGRHEFWPHLV